MKKLYSMVLATCLYVVIPGMVTQGMAQSPFVLSNSSDFSTDVRAFSRTDTLYIKVFRPDIDFTNLEDMEYQLKAKAGEGDIEGHFTNHFDGTYTAKIFLGATNPNQSSWELSLHIADQSENKFKMKVSLTITDNGNPPPSGDHQRMEIKGHISDIQADQILVQGLWITVDGQTQIFRGEHETLMFSDLVAGMFVKIKALSQPDGSLLATRIQVDNQGSNGNTADIQGFISAIGEDSLVVNGTTFFVDDNTEIKGGDEQNMKLSDLSIGDFVEVEGRLRDDGKLWAKSVKIEDDNGEKKEFELTGPIESITDTSIVVAGITFLLDDQTQVFNNDQYPIGFSALDVETLVEMKGEYRSDGKLWATRIKIEDSPHAEVETKGTIESINGDVIMVDGLAFKVDSTTVILGPSHAQSDLSSLEVGLLVEVKAFRQPDGDLIAVRIEIEDESSARVQLKGAIEDLTASSVTVLNTTFVVDTNTVILDKRHNPLTLADLTKGMIVEIKGRIDSSGTLVALQIKVKEQMADEIEVNAAIDSLAENLLIAGGVSFTVNDQTIILDQQKQPIGFASLQVGDAVEIKGRRLPDGTILALRIKLQDSSADQVDLRGTIAQISGDTVVVEQTVFLRDTSTVFLDRDENPITFADFSVGDFVEAEAQSQANGIWVLKKLKKEDPVSMQGQVQATAGLQITVLNTPVLITENTLVVGLFNTPLDASAIQAGSDVSIQGSLTSGGNVLASSIVVNTDAVTSVRISQNQSIPLHFNLEQNYPNPFNPSTTLRYRIESQTPQRVILRIYNLLGQQVATLVNGIKSAGSYSVVWNGQNQKGWVLPTGIYLARLQVGEQLQVRRMVLSK